MLTIKIYCVRTSSQLGLQLRSSTQLLAVPTITLPDSTQDIVIESFP